MNLETLVSLVTKGKGPNLEFKRSTGNLRDAMKTACAFLNGEGGRFFIGVNSDGTLLGQEISDKTLRDIAQIMESFEPPARISTGCVTRNTCECLDPP